MIDTTASIAARARELHDTVHRLGAGVIHGDGTVLGHRLPEQRGAGAHRPALRRLAQVRILAGTASPDTVQVSIR